MLIVRIDALVATIESCKLHKKPLRAPYKTVWWHVFENDGDATSQTTGIANQLENIGVVMGGSVKTLSQ